MAHDFYVSRLEALLADFDRAADEWRPLLAAQYGADFATAVLQDARDRFEHMIPAIPYIGGDDNHLTGALIDSVRVLAYFQAMETAGQSPETAGELLYKAILRRPAPPPIPPDQRLSSDQLMQRRKERAQRSLERRYPLDFVYTFVEWDGETYDYGYDFIECASDKFYRVQGAARFLPYYCFLDFPKGERDGLGLTRTEMLSSGCSRCNFRFREGGKAAETWPPSFASPKHSHAGDGEK